MTANTDTIASIYLDRCTILRHSSNALYLAGAHRFRQLPWLPPQPLHAGGYLLRVCAMCTISSVRTAHVVSNNDDVDGVDE